MPPSMFQIFRFAAISQQQVVKFLPCPTDAPELETMWVPFCQV